jgi:hypothetical protein
MMSSEKLTQASVVTETCISYVGFGFKHERALSAMPNSCGWIFVNLSITAAYEQRASREAPISAAAGHEQLL